MKRGNVKCPVCGHINEGVDLEETEGWAECCKCEAVFMASGYVQQFLLSKLCFGKIPEHVSKAIKA